LRLIAHAQKGEHPTPEMANRRISYSLAWVLMLYSWSPISNV